MFRSLAFPRYSRNFFLRVFLVLSLLGVLWKLSYYDLLNRKAYTSTHDYHLRRLHVLFREHNVSKSERAHVSDTADVTEVKRQEQNDKPRETVTKAQDKPEQTVTKAQDKPEQTVTKAQDKPEQTVTKAQGKLTETVTKAQGKLTETVTKAQGKLTETVTKAQGKLTETVTNAQDKSKETVTKGQDKPTETVTNAQDKSKETVTKGQDKPTETVTKAQDKSKETVTTAQDKSKETVTKAQDKPKETVTKAQDKPKETVTTAQDKSKETVTKAQDKSKETVTKAQDKPKDTVIEGLDKPRAHLIPHWTDSPASSLCPPQPPALLGNLTMLPKASNFTEVVKLNPGLEPGGHYRPAECLARHRVAIIVPYRNREAHLLQLLHNLHPMLQRQQLDYFVLVIELAGNTTFNRGILMNIGAVEAVGLRDVQCFVFHDVDMIPENDKNLYSCPSMPLHLSAAVSKWHYRLNFPLLFGGVSAFDRKQFWQVNGYSNRYFGWGGEDDDLVNRFSSHGMNLTRHAMNVARYHMFKHDRDPGNENNPNRFPLLASTNKYQSSDGLNSLQYNVTKAELREGYTWILVNVDEDTVMEGFSPLSQPE